MAQGKSVIGKEEADKIAFLYSPRRFPATVSETATDFLAYNAKVDSSFKLDKIVAQQTGIAERERLNLQEQVEREAIARIKDLQEQAYEQAYAIGLEEGREKAFAEKKEVFEAKLLDFEALLGSIESLKAELVASNETQILRLVMYLVRRLVMAEFTEKPELVLHVVRNAIQSAQTEESILVRLSPSDFAFVEETKAALGKEFESLLRAKYEASEAVSSGGCVVETNYGDVDATMEQRFEKLWAALSEKLPEVKNVVGG